MSPPDLSDQQNAGLRRLGARVRQSENPRPRAPGTEAYC